MLMATEERRGVDERYEVATQTSRILLEEHRVGAADVLVAAGWSPSRIGMALLRLHSEWTAAAKPQRASQRAVEAMETALQTADAREKAACERRGEVFVETRSVAVRAQAEADRWYSTELMLLAQSLKTRATVLDQLTQWAILRGVDPVVVGPALFHWLSPTCGACNGLGAVKATDAARLTGRRCPKCQGTGKRNQPEGSARVLSHIDYAVSVARGSLKKRLRQE